MRYDGDRLTLILSVFTKEIIPVNFTQPIFHSAPPDLFLLRSGFDGRLRFFSPGWYFGLPAIF